MANPIEQTPAKDTTPTDDIESIARRIERRRRGFALREAFETERAEKQPKGHDWLSGSPRQFGIRQKGTKENGAAELAFGQGADSVSRLSMKKLIRKGVLAVTGQTGTVLVSLMALWVVTNTFAVGTGWTYVVPALLAVIRVGYFLTRSPRPLLTDHGIRQQLGRLSIDEIKITTVWLAAMFALGWDISRITMAAFFGANLLGQTALMALGRVALRSMTRADRTSLSEAPDKQVVIMGSGDRAKQVADMILDSPELEANLLGFIDARGDTMWRYRDVPLIGGSEDLETLAGRLQIDALFVAVEADEIEHTRSVFETAEKMGVAVCVMPSLYEPTVSRLRVSSFKGQPVMVYRAVPENRLTLLAKSLMDKTGALIGLALTAPVMLLTALVIKIDSRGPVFFKQVRSGLNNRPFYLYKFRTMVTDADSKKAQLLGNNEMSGPVFKMQNDPRITRVGRWLRKFSIDELPQFINVLKGEMSLVGPRPPLPNEVAGFEPWQRRKLSVKPGVTCLWQVNGRNSIDFEDWMKLDLQYIDNWSLWLDAKIVARTIPTVVKGTGV